MISHPLPTGAAPLAAARPIAAIEFANGRPFVIDEPGRYVLVGDVDWIARDADARALTIAADDVELDLNGHTLRQIRPSEPRRERGDEARPYKGEVVSGNVGIWSEGRRGLRICNGSVADVQGVGIALKDCDDVELVDLTARSCGGDGVVDTSFLYRNGGIFVMGTRHAGGDVRVASGVRLVRCRCVGNVSALDYVVTLGSLLLYCQDVQVRDCAFDATSNTSPQPSGVQFNVVGLDLVMCDDVVVENCVANDNESGGEPAGFFAWGHNVKFVRCEARGNFTTMGNRVCGFNLSDVHGFELQDCTATGNHNGNPEAAADDVRDFSAAGFRIGRRASHGTITDCAATDNYSVGRRAPVAGFVLNSADDVVLRGCSSSGHLSMSIVPTPEAFAAGFLSTVPCVDESGQLASGRRNRFIDCVSDGASTSLAAARPNTGNGAGFWLEGQRGGEVAGCRSLNDGGHGCRMVDCEEMQIDTESLGRPIGD